MRWIAVAPTDRFGDGVVAANIPANASSEIVDRGKDATCQEIALNFGKPEFDLIQPRRIGRRKVQPHLGIVEQETAHGLSFVRGQIIEDHVNLAGSGRGRHHVGQEFDERRTRVSGGRLPEHLTGARVQGREERQRAMPEILEPVTFRAARLQRQDRIQPIQRLNRRFLVDGKHGGVLGRVEVQPDHVRRFRLEIRIVSSQIPLQQLWSPHRFR